MISVKSLKKLSSGVLLSSMVNVVQSSVGFSFSNNAKQENNDEIGLNVKKDDKKVEDKREKSILEMVEENKVPLAAGVTGLAVLVPSSVYVARKLHNSPFKEQFKEEAVNSLEQADPHSETLGIENDFSQNESGKSENLPEKSDVQDVRPNEESDPSEKIEPADETSGTENEAPKNDLNIENTKNKEEKGQDDNKSLQNNSPEENLPLNESSNQEASEKDALINGNQETLKSTDLESPKGEDESSKKEENKVESGDTDGWGLTRVIALVMLLSVIISAVVYFLIIPLIDYIRGLNTFMEAVKTQYEKVLGLFKQEQVESV